MTNHMTMQLTHEVVLVLWSMKNFLPLGAICICQPGGRGPSGSSGEGVMACGAVVCVGGESMKDL